MLHCAIDDEMDPRSRSDAMLFMNARVAIVTFMSHSHCISRLDFEQQTWQNAKPAVLQAACGIG